MTKAPLNIDNGADSLFVLPRRHQSTSLNLSLNAKSEFAVNQENVTILNRPTKSLKWKLSMPITF